MIFDIDGTLVDSNDAHAQSWVDTFAEAGYDSGGWKDEALAGAVETYDGPAHLLANYELSLLERKTG